METLYCWPKIKRVREGMLKRKDGNVEVSVGTLNVGIMTAIVVVSRALLRSGTNFHVMPFFMFMEFWLC